MILVKLALKIECLMFMLRRRGGKVEEELLISTLKLGNRVISLSLSPVTCHLSPHQT